MYRRIHSNKTEFESGKVKKVKKVNPTATSKILHSCCPDLFVMWDANIRARYHKYNGEGTDYYQFLVDTREVWNALGDTVSELSGILINNIVCKRLFPRVFCSARSGFRDMRRRRCIFQGKNNSWLL